MIAHTFELNIPDKTWENFINSITFGCYSWVSLVEDSEDGEVYLTEITTRKSYHLSKEDIENVILDLILHHFTLKSPLTFNGEFQYQELMSRTDELNCLLHNEDYDIELSLVNILCQLAIFKKIVYIDNEDGF